MAASGLLPAWHAVARSCAARELSELRGAQGRHAVGSGEFRVHVVVRGLRAGAGQGDADRRCGQAAWRARHALVADRRALRLARGGGAGFVAGAAHRRRRNRGAARPRLCQPVRRHGAAQSHLRGRRQGRRDGEGIRGFPRGARRQARGGHRRQHRHGGGVRSGDQGELRERRDHVRQIPRHQTRQRGRRPGATRGSAEQLPDQGPALHLPQERRSSDAGGEGSVVKIGSCRTWTRSRRCKSA